MSGTRGRRTCDENEEDTRLPCHGRGSQRHQKLVARRKEKGIERTAGEGFLKKVGKAYECGRKKGRGDLVRRASPGAEGNESHGQKKSKKKTSIRKYKVGRKKRMRPLRGILGAHSGGREPEKQKKK